MELCRIIITIPSAARDIRKAFDDASETEIVFDADPGGSQVCFQPDFDKAADDKRSNFYRWQLAEKGEKMKKFTRVLSVLLVVAVVLGSAGAVLAQDKKPVVGVVLKSLANEFFKTLQEGAEKWAEEDGRYELNIKGMNSETDIDTQLTIMDTFISLGVDMIVLAPADSSALVPSVVKAQQAGIPVVNFDVRLDADQLKTAGLEDFMFVGPDNEEGAYLAGMALAEKLGEGGKVFIIEGNPGADNAIARKAGFDKAVAEGKLELLESSTAHWETEEANTLVANLLTAYPDVQGIMCANDSMVLGAQKAVEAAGRDDILLVGFDNIAAVQELIKEGKVLATVDQFGAEMVQMAIEVGQRVIDGELEPVGWEKTPVELITIEDLE